MIDLIFLAPLTIFMWKATGGRSTTSKQPKNDAVGDVVGCFLAAGLLYCIAKYTIFCFFYGFVFPFPDGHPKAHWFAGSCSFLLVSLLLGYAIRKRNRIGNHL